MTDDQFTDVRFAGFWIRFAAAFLDGLVLLPLVALEFYNKIQYHSTILLVIGTLLTMLYKPYLEYTRGATFGKQLVNIRVVSESLENISMDQAILRYMPWFISAFFGLMLSFSYYASEEYATNLIELTEKTQDSFWTDINSTYFFVFIFIVGVVAFDQRKQGIHDKLARTFVVHN